MDQPLPVSTIAHLIQLAIAPVFLLAGIAGILNVLAQRLSRVVDRGRGLERDFASFDEATRERASEELLIIIRRMRIVNLAITESRKPNRIGRCGRTASRLWPCQGLASLRPIRSAIVGATSRRVAILSCRPAGSFGCGPTIRNGVQTDSR